MRGYRKATPDCNGLRILQTISTWLLRKYLLEMIVNDLRLKMIPYEIKKDWFLKKLKEVFKIYKIH